VSPGPGSARSAAAGAALVILIQAAPVLATGINLFWNDCSIGATATTNRNFACDTNEGWHVLVGSFDPPDGISMVNGVSAAVDVYSASCPMTSWWQFKNPGFCRRFALSANAVVLPGQGACADQWQGQAGAAVIAYLVPLEQSYRRARIGISVSVPTSVVGPVQAGTEYYAFNLVIRNENTVGAGSCAGCADPTSLSFYSLKLHQPVGTPGGSPELTNPAVTNFVTWQVSPVGPGCFYPWCEFEPCTTPTVNRTWGQIKSIYR
jgi:hypothetical protein